MDKSGHRFCVYFHYRPDTNDLFYVGIGLKKRPYIKSRRNKFWQHVVDKNNGRFIVDVLCENQPWDLCCFIEKDLIKKYGRRDNGTGILCNLTDGGEGACRPVTEETKKKQREYRLNNPVPEHHMRYLANLNKTRVWTKESRAKVGEASRGRTLSPDSLIKRYVSRLRNYGYVVEQVCLTSGSIINTFSGITEAARAMNVSPSGIAGVMYGKYKHCRGFMWRKSYNNDKLEEFVSTLESGFSDRNPI